MNKYPEENKPSVFVVSGNVLSPIGKTTAENFSNLKKQVSAVKQYNNLTLSPLPFFAALFENNRYLANGSGVTRFEQLLIESVTEALQQTDLDVKDKKNILIVSSTKGNISLLETEEYSEELKKRIALTTSAKIVADHFGFENEPVVVSNACISGVLAIITGMRLLQAGVYENAIITGADTISRFILSGFQSFQALSGGVCKPFDKDHDGLNLGEGAGTIILSVNKKYNGNIKVKGGSVSNDANHISGPSRTGKELSTAILKAMLDAGITAKEIDFISAHGTATVYNDEMEANALSISGLQSVPANSLKGYYGHTLGAAGLIESIISTQSLAEDLVLPTLGFNEAASPGKINVSAKAEQIDAINFLKTASGFGGCNAAVIFGK